MKKTVRYFGKFAGESIENALMETWEVDLPRNSGFSKLESAQRWCEKNWQGDYPTRKITYFKITVEEIPAK